jgi:hypothetical protein
MMPPQAGQQTIGGLSAGIMIASPFHAVTSGVAVGRGSAVPTVGVGVGGAIGTAAIREGKGDFHRTLNIQPKGITDSDARSASGSEQQPRGSFARSL